MKTWPTPRRHLGKQTPHRLSGFSILFHDPYMVAGTRIQTNRRIELAKTSLWQFFKASHHHPEMLRYGMAYEMMRI